MTALGETAWAVRAGRAQDAPACTAVEAACAALFLDSPRPEVAAHQAAPPSVYAAIAERGGLIVAALERTPGVAPRVIGLAATEAEADGLHLHELDVDPRFQRRGIGRALLAAVEARARALGLPRATLTTWSDVIWNAPMYARLGWEVLPRKSWSKLCAADTERLARAGFDSGARVAMAKRV